MTLLALAYLFASAGASSAGAPRLENAHLVARPAGADPAATFKSAVAEQREPGWIGYSVPGAAGRTMCCWESFDGGFRGDGACRLEREGSYGGGHRRRTVALEDDGHMVVLARVSGGRIEKLRTFSSDCELDAGGRSVVWLSSLDEVHSVRILAPLAAQDVRKVSDGAMHALSAHGGRPSVDALIALAKTHATTRTRGQALFWLAQRAGEQARATITQAIEDDPETDVKKKAVFALSQLPQDEGVPLLIRTARQNRNPEVRRQAMFWLGQSHDRRAVTFFEEILTR